MRTCNAAVVLLAATLTPAPAAYAQALNDLPVLATWSATDTRGQSLGMTTGIAVSRDGRYVLSGYYEQSVLSDAQSGKSLGVLAGHKSNAAVAFLGDGQRAITSRPPLRPRRSTAAMIGAGSDTNSPSPQATTGPTAPLRALQARCARRSVPASP